DFKARDTAERAPQTPAPVQTRSSSVRNRRAVRENGVSREVPSYRIRPSSGDAIQCFSCSRLTANLARRVMCRAKATQCRVRAKTRRSEGRAKLAKRLRLCQDMASLDRYFAIARVVA